MTAQNEDLRARQEHEMKVCVLSFLFGLLKAEKDLEMYGRRLLFASSKCKLFIYKIIRVCMIPSEKMPWVA